MVEYSCSRCHKKFKLKGDYARHTNRKFPCSIVDPIMEQKITCKKEKSIQKSIYECDLCHVKFTKKNNLKRHIENRCTKKKEDNKEKLFQQLLEEMKLIKEKNKDLESQLSIIKSQTIINNTNNTQNITNNTNNTQNITNNNTINLDVKLEAFGENCKWIPEDKCIAIINNGGRCIQKLVEFVHFNKKKPEYHNVYISNMQNKYAMVYDGENWTMQEKNDIINQIWDEKTYFIESKFEELKDKVKAERAQKFEIFLNKYEEDLIKNQNKDSIKLLLYNKRKLVENTKKKQDDGKLLTTK